MNSLKPASIQIESNLIPKPDQEAFMAKVAAAHGFEIYKHYSEAQAAKLLYSSVSSLQRARANQEIGFIRKGPKTIAYFGFQLAEYLLSNTTCPNQNAASN